MTRRKITLDLYDQTTELDVSSLSYGVVSMLVLIAYDYNNIKGINLYFRLINVAKYYELKNLDNTNLTGDLEQAEFNITEMQDALNFINDDLIPHLNSENRDIYEIYGGKSQIEERIKQAEEDGEFSFHLDLDDIVDVDSDILIYYLNCIKLVLSESIRINKPYYCMIT